MSKMEGYQTLLSEAQNVEQEPALQIHVCLLRWFRGREERGDLVP